MTKSFNITREILGKLAPFILVASFPLHIFLIYLGSAYDSIKMFHNVSYLIMIFGLAFWSIYFIFNIVKYALDIKKKNNPDEKEFYNYCKFSAWGIKNHNLIKLILSSICFLSLFLPCIVALCKINSFYFFNVYFAIWISLTIVFFCYLLNAILFAKNKTTFIVSIIIICVMFVFLIASAVYVFEIYFGFGSNKRIADIMLLFVVTAAVVLQFKDVAYDDIIKSKRGANIFIGVISLAVAIFIVIAKSKCVFYIEDYITRDGTYNLSTDVVPFVNMLFNVVKYLFLGVILTAILNFAFGVNYYRKRRDVFGFIDLAASIAAVFVSFFAITNLSKFMFALI